MDIMLLTTPLQKIQKIQEIQKIHGSQKILKIQVLESQPSLIILQYVDRWVFPCLQCVGRPPGVPFSTVRRRPLTELLCLHSAGRPPMEFPCIQCVRRDLPL